MKKTICSAVMAVAALSASAEGYQVNTLSAKQTGMGHVGVAMKLGAESQIFNPAAVAFSDKTLELSAAMAAIYPTATAVYDGKKYETSNKVSTPMNVSASFRIYDNLYAGVAFYTPYGSSINWGDNWPGAILNQSVDLKVMTVQPTVSWRILPNVSIGAGLMISWGGVDLNKALVSASSMDKVIDLQYQADMLKYTAETLAYAQNGMANPNPAPTAPEHHFGDVAPASANLKGNSDLALGFNVGAMWDINEKFTVGASFRSEMNMHVAKGDAKVSYANTTAQAILGETLDNLNYTNFEASMPAPYILTFGVSYKPIEKLVLAFDAQLNGWSTYKSLDIEFDNLEAFNQYLTKNYSDAWTLHFGGQYAMTNRLDLRAGVMVDFSPCDENYYNPETPGQTRINPSVGLSFRPMKDLSVDLAFMYVEGLGAEGTGQYSDFLAPQYNAAVAQYNAGVDQINPILSTMGMSTFNKANPLPTTGEFTAKYDVRALIPSIGISYSF